MNGYHHFESAIRHRPEGFGDVPTFQSGTDLSQYITQQAQALQTALSNHDIPSAAAAAANIQGALPQSSDIIATIATSTKSQTYADPINTAVEDIATQLTSMSAIMSPSLGGAGPTSSDFDAARTATQAILNDSQTIWMNAIQAYSSSATSAAQAAGAAAAAAQAAEAASQSAPSLTPSTSSTPSSTATTPTSSSTSTAIVSSGSAAQTQGQTPTHYGVTVDQALQAMISDIATNGCKTSLQPSVQFFQQAINNYFAAQGMTSLPVTGIFDQATQHDAIAVNTTDALGLTIPAVCGAVPAPAASTATTVSAPVVAAVGLGAAGVAGFLVWMALRAPVVNPVPAKKKRKRKPS